MCATCGSIGKYGQAQPEAIKADKEKLERVTASALAKRAKQN
jgi:hypothetical protein